MFMAIKFGFTAFKVARSLFSMATRTQRVGKALTAYRSHAHRLQRNTAQIPRQTQGVQRSINDTVRAADRLGASSSRLASRGLLQLEVTTNAAQVADDLGAMVDKIDKEIVRALTAAGSIIAGEAGRSAFKFRYLGQLHRSYAVEVKSLGPQHVAHIGSNLVHAAVQEFGRKPGKMPPHAPIAAWAERKGIDANLVYPIRRKIARKGTPARRNLGRAMESKEKEIRDLFERRINAVLSSL